jgi:phage host-nuclease inhibitor protein Gam
MKTIKITSPESLDAQVAEVIRLKVAIVANMAAMEQQKAAVEKLFAEPIGTLHEQLNAAENAVQDYCEAHRAELFTDKKSRDTLTAIIGYEFTPWRVETGRKKITWKEVIGRLQDLDWGGTYVKDGDPKLDKEALLRDQAELDDKKQLAAGIKFERDEQFFIRPKSKIADQTVVKEAA